jgi:hypothetical protein
MNITAGGNLWTQFKLFRSKCVTCSERLKVTASSDKQAPLHWRRVHLRAKTPYISFLANSIAWCTDKNGIKTLVLELQPSVTHTLPFSGV